MNGMDVFRAMQEAIPDGRDLSDSELNSVYNAVGGEEQYGNLIGWAKLSNSLLKQRLMPMTLLRQAIWHKPT